MFITIYILFPLIIYLYPWILAKCILLNTAFITVFTNLKKPDYFKFTKGNWRYLRIKNNYSKCELGAWEIICKEDEINNKDKLNKEEFMKIFSNGRPIIIYFHGITMHRGSSHRVELYHMLRNSGYHILTVDYKGFGDSSGSINDEEELLEDAFVTYQYAKKVAPNSPLFVWGHSLGTGISSLLLKKLSNIDGCASIDGLILESPFTSILETMDHICFTWPWRYMPYFNCIFKQSLIDQKITFSSIENLKVVNVPIIILHAEDDRILKFEMGQKLYSTLKSEGKNVFFKGFSSKFGYGHKHIIRYPELPNLIREFTNGALTQKLSGHSMCLQCN